MDEYAEYDHPPAPLWKALLVLAMGLAVIAGVYALVYTQWVPVTGENVAIGAGVGLVYFAVCYYFKPPEPNWEDLFPLLGAFTFRDEAAWATLVAMIIMLPGHAVVLATTDLFRHVLPD